MAISESDLEQLRAEFGDILVIETALGEFAFKTPSLEDYEDYQEVIFNVVKGRRDKSKGQAARQLCQRCLVWPKPPEGASVLKKAFETKPAYPLTIATHLADLAGDDLDIEAKK